jgi:hypothetical protein
MLKKPPLQPSSGTRHIMLKTIVMLTSMKCVVCNNINEIKMSTVGYQIKMYAHGLHRVGYFNNYCPEPEKVYNIQSTFLFALTGVRNMCNAFISFCKKNGFCLVNIFETFLLFTMLTVCEDIQMLIDVCRYSLGYLWNKK